MKHKRDNSLFAFMFSDLMMGAMAIVTVMLIFLSVVAVKGQGAVESVNLVDLPPGLLDSNSMPYVRIRLVACGSKIQRDGLHLDPPPDSTSISSSQQADCTVTLYQFPSGLEEHSVDVVSSREGETPEIDVLVSVGGWHGYFELSTISAKAGQSLATISLRDPQRIFRRL